MKIILLTGPSSCGKTTTMTKLYDELTRGMIKKPAKRPIPKTGKKDFQCDFTYKNKKIAVFSAGDTILLLLMALFTYSDVDCLIAAFNQGGNIKTEIIAAFNATHKHTQIRKTVRARTASYTDKDAANDNDCRTIINAI
jgi:molybdopterin-guanine dinucleotide biosynthesis protein